ncbi:MAG: galactokinase [Lachnospiraceae bacterium]|nr:galactokinase [Lachnospiraceae bacterium]MBR4210521.1 galactokinase [Lachnospiraceae bacterium]
MEAEKVLIEEGRKAFGRLFGEGGDIRVYFAPGRVNLIGEHTDYNGGHVFPCALSMGTWGIARAREDRKIRLFSANIPKCSVWEADLSDLKPTKEAGWANYPLGVIWALEKKGYPMEKGFDMVVTGNVPNGSGLSSSASLEVMTGVMAKDLGGFNCLELSEIAQISQFSENEFNGMNCGIMDQFASAMGKKDRAIFLDTATLQFEYVPVVLPDAHIVITNSKVKHSLVGSAYNDRRRECEEALRDLNKVVSAASLGALTEQEFEQYKGAIENPVCVRRARHAVCENQRTFRAVEALKAGNLEEFGKLMNASHVSLRDDYEVSCEELDKLAELAWETEGVIGSRMTGGGFGGCTVSLVKNDALDAFREHLTKGYEAAFGITPEFYIADVGEGAHRIS